MLDLFADGQHAPKATSAVKAGSSLRYRLAGVRRCGAAVIGQQNGHGCGEESQPVAVHQLLLNPSRQSLSRGRVKRAEKLFDGFNLKRFFMLPASLLSGG